MTERTPLLELRDVNTYYGQIHILQGVNLRVFEGEFVALLGGNACGKSTTLKTAVGLVTPKSGSVLIDG
ncbi:MAG: ATP-binding cassette domain-containing protein, partial [Actinobacteria bacterium]|nr:ATP-binding cassette domain-containing protein [Actinomycetota bacterium]